MSAVDDSDESASSGVVDAFRRDEELGRAIAKALDISVERFPPGSNSVVTSEWGHVGSESFGIADEGPTEKGVYASLGQLARRLHQEEEPALRGFAVRALPAISSIVREHDSRPTQPPGVDDRGISVGKRDLVAGAAHAVQMTQVAGPVLHHAAQAVGVVDAIKVGSDLVAGKEVRPIEVASAVASVAMTTGLGGPAVQTGAKAVSLLAGLDAAERGGNTLAAAYEKAVNTPTIGDVADRKDIELRHAAPSRPLGEQSAERDGTKVAQDLARADVASLHAIDDKGEREYAISAMARTAAKDGAYREALARVDPFTAEVVDAATKSQAALREIERSSEAAKGSAPMSKRLAKDRVIDDLQSLRSIAAGRDRAEALGHVGSQARQHPNYEAELSKRDPEIARQASMADRLEQRAILAKEERKGTVIEPGSEPNRNVGEPPELSAIDKLAASLDVRLEKSELEERGWKGRDDLADVLRDLEKLSQLSWQRAAELWEKYLPEDTDKPKFLASQEAEKAQTPMVKAIAVDNAVDRGQKEAERGQPEPKEVEFVTPDSIRKRFIQADNKYFYREDENRLAFEDKGKRLATVHNDPEVARSMVELAEAKGWDAINVKGSDAFKRTVWLQASLRGLEVNGFAPKDVDLSKLEELKAEKGKLSSRSEGPAQNVVEQTAVRQRVPQPERLAERDDERGAAVDEHQRTLSKPQQQAVEALKAILRNRGDSEKAVAMAADVAAARFQNNRVHVGKILAHGQAPYEHDEKNASSYYVKLQTERGEKEVWGVDLRRAIGDSQSKVGDDVALSYQGRQKVTVGIPERDAQGKVTGQREISVDRNTWDVNRLEVVRDEVRESLRAAAERTDTRQPLVKIYDRNAPREELRPEPIRDRGQRNERTR